MPDNCSQNNQNSAVNINKQKFESIGLLLRDPARCFEFDNENIEHNARAQESQNFAKKLNVTGQTMPSHDFSSYYGGVTGDEGYDNKAPKFITDHLRQLVKRSSRYSDPNEDSRVQFMFQRLQKSLH